MMGNALHLNGQPRRDRGEVLDTTPPNAIDSERALLSGVMVAGRIDQDVVLGASEFYDCRHQAVWDCLVGLDGEHGRIDVPALLGTLKEHRRWGKDGLDSAYVIGEVATAGGSADRQAWHADRIHAAYVKRTVSHHAEFLLQKARGPCEVADLRDTINGLADFVDGNRPGGPRGGAIEYGLISGRELLRREYPVEYLISGVLAKGQHCLLGGPGKALKSCVALDLAVSLARGGHFLGYFPVQKPTRTVVMSGESGWRLLQDNVKRIGLAAGALEEDLDNLLVGTKLPKFGDLRHTEAIRSMIRDTGAEVAIIDCAYMCFPAGDKASNLLSMGELLNSIGDVFVETDCTAIILHHATKHIPPGDPLELGSLAFAGFTEWAAQWLLLNRLERYEPGTGHHDLWLTIGARAGHGGLYGLRVDEGVFQEGQSRQWDVRVCQPDEMRQGRQDQREQQKVERQAETIRRNADKITRFLSKHPDGETEKSIRSAAGISGGTYHAAVAWLLEEAAIVPCEVQKPNRKAPYTGYKLA